MPADLQLLAKNIRAARLVRPVGRVVSVEGGTVRVTGLSDHARINAQVMLNREFGRPLSGEIIRVDPSHIHVLPGFPPEGLRVGDRVILHEVPGLAPCDDWIGRVIDPFGRPLDNKPLPRGPNSRDINPAPPPAAERRQMGARLETGLSVFNTLLPIARGQRLGLFAGSGVGKSSLMAHMARNLETDIAVIALIGERGREVSEFVEKTMGPDGMKRAVVIAATSDQSALIRRRCAWAAMTVAEHFRDQGRQVMFLADSITRFAEAHREIAALSGETPALRGYPPSLNPMITGLCERAGPGIDGQGDITAILSVLVAGSDMDEPVADTLRGVLDGHVVLSREIAERGRYPAIDVIKSVSRCLPDAATQQENDIILEVRKLLGAYEHSEVMIKAGLYAEGSDAVLDHAVRSWPELDSFIAAPEAGGISNSFDKLTLLLRRTARPS